MKNGNDFKIGFEIECVINASKIDLDVLTKKLQLINRHIVVEDDDTIDAADVPWNYNHEVDDYSAEIQTPPIITTKAVELLAKIFKLLNTYGYTNESCGLHVNISTTNTDKFANMNLLYICFHPIFKQIVKEFGRQDNCYCRVNHYDHKIWYCTVNNEIIDYGLYTDKEAAVNFSYAGDGTCGDQRRIEVRAFGNKKYHRRLPAIRNYIHKVLKVLRKSMEYKFDYLK